MGVAMSEAVLEVVELIDIGRGAPRLELEFSVF